LFNWFSKQKANDANRFTYEADIQQTEKIKNDVALNVAVAYLQILLAREQVNLSKIQVLQTISQLESTQKQSRCRKVARIKCCTIGSPVGYR
jgi:outer membrane protein